MTKTCANPICSAPFVCRDLTRTMCKSCEFDQQQQFDRELAEQVAKRKQQIFEDSIRRRKEMFACRKPVTLED